MDPIETLVNEHGLIRQFVDILSQAVEKMEDGKRPPREFFEKSVDFARTFADAFHHFKEEHVMFVRLAQKKRGEIDGQIEALRYQHDRGRSLVTGMWETIDGYDAGDEMKTGELIEHVAAYASLLRHHIHIENHVFFPMARSEMADEELAKLQVEFDMERERHGADTFEQYHKIAVDLHSMLVHL